MISVCCPRCLLLNHVPDEHEGKRAKCQTCKTSFTLSRYKPEDHIKPDLYFEDPSVRTPLRRVFEALDALCRLINPPPKATDLYVRKMLELVTDDMMLSEEDAENLIAYGEELGLPESDQKALQQHGLRKLLRLLMEDGVLDEEELDSLRSVEANGLLPEGALTEFSAAMERPRILGLIEAGQLPILPSNLLDCPKKDEVLHWTDAFEEVGLTKTKLKSKEDLELFITSQRLLMVFENGKTRSIPWPKVCAAGREDVQTDTSGVVRLLSITKSTAKTPLYLYGGDTEVAVLLINGIKQGVLHSTGIVSAD